MTRANAQPGCRHHVGNLAGFKSERVAGFRLECMAGFVGIRSFPDRHLDHFSGPALGSQPKKQGYPARMQPR